jgi:ABC-2 type transport system permease protein
MELANNVTMLAVMLSGATTPRDSIPAVVRLPMLLAPTTHYIAVTQAILLRGAGPALVWPQLLALAAIGAVLFGAALWRFGQAGR